MTKKQILILGGGTTFHVRPHLALSAPAYGKTAREIYARLLARTSANIYDKELYLTKMADPVWGQGETNQDVDNYVTTRIINNPDAKIVFFSVALCDFEGTILDNGGNPTPSGKDQPRLRTAESEQVTMSMVPSRKIIARIRKERKDIFLVGFKTTAGATEEEQYRIGLRLLKTTSCNLVLANDVHTRKNMIIAPELAKYSVTENRSEALNELVDITLARASNVFSRTEVLEGGLLNWQTQVPSTLTKVVDWCVSQGAYKPFNNVTVGHFGCRPQPGILWSSRRKKNFNLIEDRDLVEVDFRKNPEQQIARGAKPSAGARSQYIVLSKYTDLDCIVHFHCPLKPGVTTIPVRSQKYFECGSHQCGKNTADGMEMFGTDIAAVMLDKHGPNIVFSSKTDPEKVIQFIRDHFDLTLATE